MNKWVPHKLIIIIIILQILKDNTRMSYDWSFYMAWTGVGFSLVSAILFSGAAICLRGEREREEALNMQYLMPGRCIYLYYIITTNIRSSMGRIVSNIETASILNPCRVHHILIMSISKKSISCASYEF